MLFKNLGMLLKKNTKTKVWWTKLCLAFILSNIFFFVLFGQNSDVKQVVLGPPEGWVEVQLQADLLTPFHSGKKVLIIHRIGRKKIEGVLQTSGTDLLGKFTVLVKEDEAHALFQHEAWEILPYLKHMQFAVLKKEASHEIRY